MATTRTLHLVPQFHYDIEYLLPVEPYLEACFENLREAHRLLAAHPEYTYLVEQAFLLEQFLQEYPSLAHDFRGWVEEGRLEIASGMYAMADINMPSGESILRQLVIGKRWCENHLEYTPIVLNMGDCTGHPAQMPQIAKHCGYEFFVFMRAVDDVKRKSEIAWQGIDGTEIATYWLAAGYSGWVPPISQEGPLPVASPRQLENVVSTVVSHALSNAVLLPHGGDFVYPYEKGLLDIAEWNRAHPERQISYSTYTKALKSMEWDKAPAYSGEWNPDRTGCYSSRIRIKQDNRASEALLMTAEAVSVLAHRRLGIPPDHEGLLRAWKLACVNQFHDILWGTILDEAYQHALDRARRVRMIAEEIIERRLQAICDAQSEAGPGIRRLIAFNPLPWSRKADIPASPDDESGPVTRIELPPCGYRILDIPAATREGTPPPTETPFSCSDEPHAEGGKSLAIVTPFYRARIAPSGVISSLVRVQDGLEFVDSARPWFNAICFQSDQGDPWRYYEGPIFDGGPHGFERELIHDPYPLEPQFTRNGRRLLGLVFDNRLLPATEITIRERNADRLVIGIRGEFCRPWPNFRRFKQFGIRILYDQTITFRADTPRIDFRLRTTHEKGRWYRLRAAFFTAVRNGEIVHEIPFGRFSREEGEFAAQNYMAHYDAEKGIALFNRGLPGNNVTDGVMMLSLMRSVSMYARADSDRAFEEGTEQVFDYAILPFGGRAELDTAALAREGAEFASPPYVFEKATARLPVSVQGTMSSEDGLLSIEPKAICCTAVYPHENVIVVRLFESDGKAAESMLGVNFAFESAAETDALLRRPSPLERTQEGIRLSFRPFEIKTIVIRNACLHLPGPDARPADG